MRDRVLPPYSTLLTVSDSVGNLRLQLPQLVESYNGTLNATAFGNQCFQEAAATLENVPPEVLEGLAPALSLLGQTSNVTQSEDCE